MRQVHMAVVFWLLVVAVEAGSATEVVYDVYSPVSIAKDGHVRVTLDGDGLIRRVEEYLYVTPDRHFVPDPDDRPLELFMTTVVETVPEGLRVVRTDGDDEVVQETIFEFIDEDEIRYEGWTQTWKVELRDANASFLLRGADGTVVDYRRESGTLTIHGMRPEGLTETYDWSGEDYLYTKVRAFDDRRLEAFARFHPDGDVIVVEQPQDDDPSPYAWRYDVYNATELLGQRFNRRAAALNRRLITLYGGAGLHLLPLFAINELGE